MAYAVTRGSTWIGSAQLHTVMESIATLLAMIVGAMPLVRFYAKQNNTFLFIGTGFLGTAFLDGYHAIVTSAFFKPFMPSDLPALIPWSWVASRQFLSILIFLSIIAWLREQRLGEAGRVREKTVYVFAALFTLASFLFFAFVPLPRAYYPEFVFHRPEEFLPALFFLLALIGYLRKGEWRSDAFEHWLVLSLIVGLVGQAVFMSFSGTLFDMEFDAAHTLKKVGYICVLVGLFINMYVIFRRAEESAAALATANEQLQSDITARKSAETMKNEFISTVSHELRSPLTSIQGSLGLLIGGASGEMPEKARSLIELAHRNCGRLVRLINDLLDIEKIEAGKLDFDLQRHDLVALVGQSVQMNQPFADKFEVGIVLEKAPEKAVAMVDADRFAQVMANLLSNAAKHSRKNTQIEISIARSAGWIEVAVADRGPGIPKEFHDRVFEKFTQADSSDIRRSEGTGLGLSIVKTIVEKQGGRIGFESAPGVGTTFKFSFPDLTEGPGSSPIARSGAPTDARREAARVLICDDDPDIATLLAQMLSSSGYVCDIAEDAEQAIVKLAERDYAAMSLDLLLPGRDGISFIRELRRDPRTRALPIIVVSVRAEEGRTEITNGHALSVVDWLQKPVDPLRLLRAVRLGVDSSVLKPRILFVNGEDGAAAKIAARLGEILTVVDAPTLDQAMARIRDERFDLIVLDLGTPGSRRQEILESIREIAGAALPVMFLTDEHTLEDLAAEIAEILARSPTSGEDLRRRIESLISSGRKGEQTEEAVS